MIQYTSFTHDKKKSKLRQPTSIKRIENVWDSDSGPPLQSQHVESYVHGVWISDIFWLHHHDEITEVKRSTSLFRLEQIPFKCRPPWWIDVGKTAIENAGVRCEWKLEKVIETMRNGLKRSINQMR